MAIVTKQLDTESAGGFAWAAAQDAMRRNENNKSHYTASQKKQALSWQGLLDYAYSYSEMFVNYRQKFIVIKLEQARVKDRVMLQEVEDILASHDVIKTVSNQGVSYRFAKV